jgi:hypothetical protein
MTDPINTDKVREEVARLQGALNNDNKPNKEKKMYRQIIAIVFASLLISFSAGASYTAEVGCITVSDYEGVEKIADNLTDKVTLNDKIELMNIKIELMNINQVKPFEEAFLYRRWGRVTRRHRDWLN